MKPANNGEKKMLLPEHILRTIGPEESRQFVRPNLTHVGTVAGVRFYEHPIHGDESPLIAKFNGDWVATFFWEIEDAHAEFYFE